MNEIRTRIHIAEDGSISGKASREVPPGDHEASIVLPSPYPPRLLPPDAAANVHALQQQIARLPVLDPRTPDEIIGYREDGLPH